MSSVPGLVDVLVPTYQHENYIDECIESIFTQDYKNILVHVFDDCSTDSTYSKLINLQVKWGPRLNIYRNKVRQGRAHNAIMCQSPNLKGEFWAVLEGDDFWCATDKLRKQVDILANSKSVVAVGSKTEVRNSQSNMVWMISTTAKKWNYYDLVLNSQRYNYFLHISSILWRNIYANQGVPWPTSYLNLEPKSEVLLMSEILKYSKKHLVFLDSITSVYRYTGQGLWSSLSLEQQNLQNSKLVDQLSELRPNWIKLIMRLRLTWILVLSKANNKY